MKHISKDYADASGNDYKGVKASSYTTDAVGTSMIGKNVRFIADAMLGKLARWMRVLGYDVEYERDVDDGELVKRSVEEDRIILTRDTLLIKRRKAKGRYFFVTGDLIADQLRQVASAFPVSKEAELTRCLRCNSPLEDVPKSSVEYKVPPYVYKTQDRFSVCLKCGKVYWAGTHKEKILKDVERLLKG